MQKKSLRNPKTLDRNLRRKKFNKMLNNHFFAVLSNMSVRDFFWQYKENISPISFDI